MGRKSVVKRQQTTINIQTYNNLQIVKSQDQINADSGFKLLNEHRNQEQKIKIHDEESVHGSSGDEREPVTQPINPNSVQLTIQPKAKRMQTQSFQILQKEIKEDLAKNKYAFDEDDISKKIDEKVNQQRHSQIQISQEMNKTNDESRNKFSQAKINQNPCVDNNQFDAGSFNQENYPRKIQEIAPPRPFSGLKIFLNEIIETFKTTKFNLWELDKTELIELEYQKYARIWTMAVLLLNIINQLYVDLIIRFKMAPMIISWLLILIGLGFLISSSRFSQIHQVKYALIILQFQQIVILYLYPQEGFENHDDLYHSHLIGLTIRNCIEIYLNIQMISKLTNRFQMQFQAVQYILMFFGGIVRFYGYGPESINDLMSHIFHKLLILFAIILFKYLDQAIMIQEIKILMNVKDFQDREKNSEKNLMEFAKLFEKLDVGLVMIKNNMIKFQNDIFNNRIIRRLKANRFMTNEPLEAKIFQLYKIIDNSSNDFSKQKQKKNEKKKRGVKIGTKFSLRDLIEEPDTNFLRDKVFVIDINDDTSSFFNLEQTYKYVHLKVKSLTSADKVLRQSFQGIEDESFHQDFLIQIIDISDKMLYNDAKAEQTFLEMINGAVSHELRNPLNSMIGQISSMQDFFNNFHSVIEQLQINGLEKKLTSKLRRILVGLENCGNKMSSAAKFIDYFVHDILDYTILNKEEKNFAKDLKLMDIRRTIEEIVEIQEDKAKIKNIDIQIKYKGFKEFEDSDQVNYLVKTDQKRMQQVLLNLYSNALKFTDREGKIFIMVEDIHEIDKRIIRISVTDTGIGIREADKEKLFKMFGSIKDEEKKLNLKGIGLGLVISKLIVEKFSGYIDFISKFQHGSTFFYTFQVDDLLGNSVSMISMCDEDQSAMVRNTQRIQKDKKQSFKAPQELKILEDNHIDFNQILKHYRKFESHSQSRILVIDDEEFCISSMKAILHKFAFDINYQVDYCLSGQEAISQLQKTYDVGYQYMLIFTDFNMPGMSGIEATLKMREYLDNKGINREKQPKIIGVTGNASRDFNLEGEKVGMNMVVTKPMYVRDLKSILKKYDLLMVGDDE